MVCSSARRSTLARGRTTTTRELGCGEGRIKSTRGFGLCRESFQVDPDRPRNKKGRGRTSERTSIFQKEEKEDES